ncbi:MAG: hypothetical protein F6K25_04275 [Okeania sp. SIO2G4]|uniref:hypothetical protein n=1 Tax=unclassified Okeania TaxID=2634635 RepID=UPI0013B62475|nr:MULTISPECIES: hypothetical protein [unclassified Okeania]NEP70939.1 hypothetical protein [Okeania sp. SIO2G5]NEP92281.1 hypothetical protein [Okeania sp. SIO2F5]NEQ89991.1 hypothetical protein [Okeania sp. SIO2G4]
MELYDVLLNTDENSHGNFGEQIYSWQVKEVIFYSGFPVTPYLKLWLWKIPGIKTIKFDGGSGNYWCSYLLESQSTERSNSDGII